MPWALLLSADMARSYDRGHLVMIVWDAPLIVFGHRVEGILMCIFLQAGGAVRGIKLWVSIECYMQRLKAETFQHYSRICLRSGSITAS